MVHDQVDRLFGDFTRVRKNTGQERVLLTAVVSGQCKISGNGNAERGSLTHDLMGEPVVMTKQHFRTVRRSQDPTDAGLKVIRQPFAEPEFQTVLFDRFPHGFGTIGRDIVKQRFPEWQTDHSGGPETAFFQCCTQFIQSRCRVGINGTDIRHRNPSRETQLRDFRMRQQLFEHGIGIFPGKSQIAEMDDTAKTAEMFFGESFDLLR